MSNVHLINEQSQREQQAAKWLIKLDADKPMSLQEKAALKKWLAQSEENRDELIGLNAFWANNVLTELMVPIYKPEPQKLAYGWRSVAASFLLVFVFVWGIQLAWQGSDTNGLYATTIGQQKTLSLGDGSVVQLNTDSQIEVEFNRNYRNIHLLQGEAYFTVAKNIERPFRVYAGASRVIAVGTAFGVYIRDNNTDVTVLEGRVALAVNNANSKNLNDDVKQYESLSRDGASNIVDAGQSVSLSNEVIESVDLAIIDKQLNIDEQELARRFSWREGLLIFRGDRLQDVVSEIGRYSALNIEINDPAVGDLRIGGQFKVGETEQMLAALQANFDLELSHIGYQHVRLEFRQQ